jgi:hypothetical protein
MRSVISCVISGHPDFTSTPAHADDDARFSASEPRAGQTWSITQVPGLTAVQREDSEDPNLPLEACNNTES